jgi:hypothetical protein
MPTDDRSRTHGGGSSRARRWVGTRMRKAEEGMSDGDHYLAVFSDKNGTRWRAFGASASGRRQRGLLPAGLARPGRLTLTVGQ